MRVVGNLAITKEVNSEMPFGATIQNKTSVQEGTPIVREYMGDVLMNLYRLLELAGITPTNTEDSDATQYQLVEALKSLPNSLNDIERVLSLDIDVWSTDLKLSLLPNKYFFLARATENYVKGAIYKFKGSEATEYTFTSSGFNSGDELLVIIDTSGVRAYSLTQSQSDDVVFPTMGIPLYYNDSNKLWYQESGNLISDEPSKDDLQSIIRTELSDGTVELRYMYVIQGYVLCFCFISSSNAYFFRQFSLLDLSVSEEVVIIGSTLARTADFSPFVYVDGNNIYITNNMNVDEEDYAFTRLNYNTTDAELTFNSSFDLDGAFDKTINAAIIRDNIYTMSSGELNVYSLTTGIKTTLATFTGLVGDLFGFNSSVYFKTNQVAKKWLKDA